MPNVICPACHLTSYVVAPHAARPQCPHCDADLLPAVARPGAGGAGGVDDQRRLRPDAA